jgi:hypothetical protein
LRLDFVVLLGKFQHPIVVDKFIAILQVETVKTFERKVVRADAVGPHKQK